MGKRLWDLAKSRFEIATILLGHRYIVRLCADMVWLARKVAICA